MSRSIRVSSSTNAGRWRACWKTHRKLLSRIPIYICQATIPEVSRQITAFWELCRFIYIRFGTNRVRANTVYQEYIADKEHLHMNSTRWVTLTEFVKHLGRSGVARVDETEKGLYIAWIDNSPKALAKAVRQTCLLLRGANLNVNHDRRPI